MTKWQTDEWEEGERKRIRERDRIGVDRQLRVPQ